MLDVLVMAAHPDDAELSTGGTIVALKEKGYKVGILDLTDGEPTPRGTRKIRLKEAEQARKELGIDFRKTLDLDNRYLMDSRLAREKVAEVMREQRPSIILSHYPGDVHPDHAAAARICKYARFYAKLTKTEMSGDPYYPPVWFNFYAMHLRRFFKPSFIMDISDSMEAKMKAVRCYQSQFGSSMEEGGFEDYIRNINRMWGSRIGVNYGEPFYSPEELGLKGIEDLVR